MPYRSPVVCGLHYGWYCFRDSQRISHKSCSLISEEELYSYLLEFNGLSCTSQAVGSDAEAWGFLAPVQVFVAMDVFTSVLQDILIPWHPLFCLCWRLPWILWSSGPSSHSPSFILDILVSLVPGNLQPRCMCWLPEHRDSPPSLQTVLCMNNALVLIQPHLNTQCWLFPGILLGATSCATYFPEK